MAEALNRIQHLVVVVLENRSFDNVLGFLYDEHRPPKQFLPENTERRFNGMPLGYSNPSNPAYFKDGVDPQPVQVKRGAHARTVPDPDPLEFFEDITFQIFGTPKPQQGQTATVNGFLVDYERTAKNRAAQIMECYTPDQVPVISQLAWNYAVCDEWYASCPCQTWPNRAFLHTGTSCGQINNWPFDPFNYDVPTIFNVLHVLKVPWTVYNDSVFESATRLQFPQLWDLLLQPHFQGFDDFKEDARRGMLPAYSFVEPSFIFEPNDQHPPHDMLLGEQFLWDVWNALSTGAHWDSTLLVITYDEHGGCCDHQPTPWGASPPDDQRPDQQNFQFDRFGVRVPLVVVSPLIEAGTVFRGDGHPYDHSSILSTIRDLQNIPADRMLKSRRVENAPTLEPVLTRSKPRSELPEIQRPTGIPKKHHITGPPNELQKSVLVAAAHRLGLRGGVKLLENVTSRQHVSDFLEHHKAVREKKKP